MQKDPSPNIEFSLVDVILPLAEMWKMLLLLPALVAGMVYLALQFYPAELTYNATVHLPEQQVRALANEAALTEALATVADSQSAVSSPRDILNRLQIVFNKEDETGLAITLPRQAASAELLGALMAIFEPAAARFLDAQKNQAAQDVALFQRTVANLKASSAAANAALEAAEPAGAGDLGAAGAPAQLLASFANSLAASQNRLYVHQMRASELASANAVQPFARASRTALIVGLAGGAALFLVLAFIYVRQEILFALSHESGRQKVARLKQSLRIFRGGNSTQP